MSTGRRTFFKLTAAASLAPAIVRAQGAAKVVGGGFGGATCARTLRKMAPAIGVTLVEPRKTYTACPFSNEVIAGLRALQRQEFGYDAIARDDVTVALAGAGEVRILRLAVGEAGDDGGCTDLGLCVGRGRRLGHCARQAGIAHYRPDGDRLVEIPGATRSSPTDADPARRTEEARNAEAWFNGTTRETFG